jgi:exodeoxyribonuclease VII small subunit
MEVSRAMNEANLNDLAELPFDEAIKRLEEVVEKLEQGEIPLEQSIQLFQEGMLLARLCSKKLEDVGRKIEVLVKENDEWRSRPYGEEESV